MTVSTPLEEAAWVYAHRDRYTKQQKFDAAASLGEWQVFSLRQIGVIVGLSHTTVRRLARPKTTKTGGTLAPESLGPLLEILRRRRRDEPVPGAEVREMLAAGQGTSMYFAAKLSGLSESWIRRKVKEK